MTSTLHARFSFLCFTLVGQSSHALVILSMHRYLMHVYVHRHFICLSCTDGEVFIQKKVGDRYWQAQNIRTGSEVNLLQEFWSNNGQTSSLLNVHLVIALQSSAVHWYECCRLTWTKFLWYLYPSDMPVHIEIRWTFSFQDHLQNSDIRLKYVVLNPELFLSWTMAFQVTQTSVQVSTGQLQKDVAVQCWQQPLSEWELGVTDLQCFLPANTMDPWLSGK